jgi:branched-chain amino acid aminotransferase
VNIDWSKLGFSYIPTKSHIEFEYANGKWNTGKIIEGNPFVSMSIAASALHYGQATFEGLKAYRCIDGKVRVFRDIENVRRLNTSAKYACMPEFPEEYFIDAVTRIVKENIEYIPPYSSNGSLYIRPVMFGSGPVIGIAPADAYKFIILVTPAGPYYKSGFKGVDAMIFEDYDRAAPNGSGRYKLAGNYAASMMAGKLAKEKGCPVVLYLDPKEHKYFDEFSSSNFFAITKNGTYVTPSSNSILPSITNKSLIKVATDMGIQVEKRPVEFSEIDNFAEVGACGTAVVITPVNKIHRGDKVYTFASDAANGVLPKLYKDLTDLQYGRTKDKYGWMRLIE